MTTLTYGTHWLDLTWFKKNTVSLCSMPRVLCLWIKQGLNNIIKTFDYNTHSINNTFNGVSFCRTENKCRV